MKKDCSKTEVFLSEWARMCNSYSNCTLGCPGYDADNACIRLTGTGFNLKLSIEIVQKWSDEHPEQTMAEKFFEMFPKAPRYETDGIPRACPYKLGWGESSYCDQNSCNTCWNRPYKRWKNENK